MNPATTNFSLKTQLIDLHNRRIFPACIKVSNGLISEIEPYTGKVYGYALPGFIDAHIHIESSMLVPSEFARIAVTHGTVATVSDPHEIANVLGMDGVRFMIENGKKVPFKFHFGAPSCVPATSFETAGATIDSSQIKTLMEDKDIYYLSELMNYPGAIAGDAEVLRKIAHAHKTNKPVDGHAPGLAGNELDNYINLGITTDHECVSYEEGLEKAKKGMKILIREGSAAKNFEKLIPLIKEFPESIMFCSDDMHPDDLISHHINNLVVRALKKGYALFDILWSACVHPVIHYKLPVGLLRIGDPADFIVVEDIDNFKVLQTYINGILVAQEGQTKISSVPFITPNKFLTTLKNPGDFKLKADTPSVRVIEALDGYLTTNEIIGDTLLEEGNLVSDTSKDILKFAVINRYENRAPSIAFIKNFGLKHGAIASSIGHDSHNILVVGVTDELMCKAVNSLIAHKGGIAAVTAQTEKVIPLPVAGLMSDKDALEIGNKYASLNQYAIALGSKLKAPFMTLSFMALLVIPHLKLSDLGLFSSRSFNFTSVRIED